MPSGSLSSDLIAGLGQLKGMKMPLEDTLIIKNLLFFIRCLPFGTFILPIVGGSFKDLLPPLIGIDLNAIARLASDADAGYAARQLALEPDDLGIIQPRS